MQPLVSCILPTRNRSAYIRLALASYLSQTYPRKELIVLDNGDDGTGDLIPSDPTIRYDRVSGERTTGEMRNLCCEAARGDVICHFDSDDWSAETRITEQVERLKQGILTGYNTLWFYDIRDGAAYKWMGISTPFALGASFCYVRDWWKSHPFELLRVGEDFRFFTTAYRQAQKHVSTVDAGLMIVALVHDDQTSKKTIYAPPYRKMSAVLLPEVFRKVVQQVVVGAR